MLNDVPHNKGVLVFGNGLGGGIQKADRGDRYEGEVGARWPGPARQSTTLGCLRVPASATVAVCKAGAACRLACFSVGGRWQSGGRRLLKKCAVCAVCAACPPCSLTAASRTAWGSIRASRGACTAASGPPACATGGQGWARPQAPDSGMPRLQVASLFQLQPRSVSSPAALLPVAGR